MSGISLAMTSEDPRYSLLATAGPSYFSDTHQQVIVNGSTPLTIETEHATVNLYVRIKDYTGLPPSSPRSHSYFSDPKHIYDQYSISISFIPKSDVSGANLVFGNEFPHPIRDRLPPGTNNALKIVKWWIDPGIDADAYADMPYLYGAALSSWNYFRICGMCGEQRSRPTSACSSSGSEEEVARSVVGTNGRSGAQSPASNSRGSIMVHTGQLNNDEVIDEGSEGSGKEVRAGFNIPEDASLRSRFFLNQQNREAFVFEAGRVYKADFGNPYLGFSDMTLRLPGFNLNVAKYIDKKNHELRYVLKNRETGDIYFVLLFTLLLGQEPAEMEAEESEEENEVD